MKVVYGGTATGNGLPCLSERVRGRVSVFVAAVRGSGKLMYVVGVNVFLSYFQWRVCRVCVVVVMTYSGGRGQHTDSVMDHKGVVTISLLLPFFPGSLLGAHIQRFLAATQTCFSRLAGRVAAASIAPRSPKTDD